MAVMENRAVRVKRLPKFTYGPVSVGHLGLEADVHHQGFSFFQRLKQPGNGLLYSTKEGSTSREKESIHLQMIFRESSIISILPNAFNEDKVLMISYYTYMRTSSGFKCKTRDFFSFFSFFL